MNKITWKGAIDTIKPYVVKISTPRGSGTGFLFAYAKGKKMCGIATAAHVIDNSYLWEELIRIEHYASGELILLRKSNRLILIDQKLDTAVILFSKEKIPFPDDTLPFTPEKLHLELGFEIGWVGFPSVSPKNLCFFTGRNSCWLEDLRTYLVDGVAINGVSGGPAFCIVSGIIHIIGCVSSYLPNRVGPTPGLAVIRDVEQFQNVIKKIKGLKEAKKEGIYPSELKEEKQDKSK